MLYFWASLSLIKFPGTAIFFLFFWGTPIKAAGGKGLFQKPANVNAAFNARCICSGTCAFPPLLSLIKMVMDVSLWMSWNSASTFFIGPQPSRVWFRRQGRAYFDTILILTFQTKERICWCHFLSGMLCFVNGTILRFLVMFKLLINTCCYSVLFYFFIYNTLSVNPSIHQWKWGWWMCVALLLPVKHPAFKSRQNTWCQKFLRLETKLVRILENGAVEHVFEGCKSEDVFFFQRERGPEKTPPRFIPYGQFSEIVWGIKKNETQSKHIKKLRIQDMTHLEQPTAEANSAQLPQKVGELCKCRVCWKVLKLLLTTWGLIECSWQLGVGWNCDSWILLAQVLRGANSFRHQSEHQLVPILVPRSRPRFYGHDQHRYEGATFKRLVHHRRCNWQPEAFADHRVYRRQDRFGRSAQHRADHPRTTSGMFLAICLSMLHSALGTSILTVVSLRILNAGMSSRYYILGNSNHLICIHFCSIYGSGFTGFL